MTLRRPGVAAAVASAAALVLTLSACSGGGAPQNEGGDSGGGAGDNSGYTIAMVTHETPGDTFWDKIKAGANQAATNYGVDLKYSQNPQANEQANLIQAAVDSDVDAIATTLVTPDALAPAVKAASDAKIPLVGFNSGIDQYKQLGALMYFGSDETLAGNEAGKRLTADGAKKPLCVIQAAGSVALEARCAGVKAQAPGTEILNVNSAEGDAAVTSTLQAKLSQDKAIDAIVTLGAPIALNALEAKKASGSQATVVTFDLNVDAAKAIKDGDIAFSIDQQPYVQGYMAVTALYLNLKNGNDIGGGKPVLTGPSFVDAANIDAILPFAEKNTR